MNDLTLTRIVAPNRLTCFQCLNLDLPIDGIEVGDTCVEIQDATGRISFACEDCFERLNIEIGSMATGEDEADELEE